MLKNWSVFLLFTCLAGMALEGCKSSQKTLAPTMTQEEVEAVEVAMDSTLPCDHSAVLTLSDDPLCGVLLVSPNGMRYQVNELADPEMSITLDKKVRVSYELFAEVETLCEEADGVIKVTCIANDWNLGPSGSDQCKDVIDAWSVDWMKSMAKEMKAIKITKYDYNEKKAYRFDGKQGSVIADCHGTELCQLRPGTPEDACDIILSQLSNATVILVVNEK